MSGLAVAEDYPILDGRRYNGLYYPNVDILEWGDPLHLEFQIYEKSKPIDVTGKTVKTGDRTVFVFTIDFPDRGERLCRRVLAPSGFVADQPVYMTRETHDVEMNNFIFSHQPIAGKSSKIIAGVDDCVERKATAAVTTPVLPTVEPETPPAFVINDPPERKSRNPASVSPRTVSPAPEVNVRGELIGAPQRKRNAAPTEFDKSEIYDSGVGKSQDDFSWIK